MKTGFVYIMTNIKHSVLYIGVTSDLEVRCLQHRMGDGGEFTSKYRCTKLVYYEEIPLIIDAIAREKQLKNWERAWKEELINTQNPEWEDLAGDWYTEVDFKEYLKYNREE